MSESGISLLLFYIVQACGCVYNELYSAFGIAYTSNACWLCSALPNLGCVAKAFRRGGVSLKDSCIQSSILRHYYFAYKNLDSHSFSKDGDILR